MQDRYHCLLMSKISLFISMTTVVALSYPTFVLRGGTSNVVPHAIGDMSRELNIDAPAVYSQVGQTLFGVFDSNITTTGTSGVDFGSNIAISDDGLRMVVGASKYDLLPSEDNVNETNSYRGAIVIYDFDGTDWIYKNHFVGAPNERLGRWPVAVSADGEVLVLRRNQPTRTEVYSVDAAGEMVQLGGSISCTNGGNGAVALTDTSDGVMRLASACTNAGGNGIVSVLDYNVTSSSWEEVGGSPLALDTTNAGGLYGFDLSWAKYGSRLAVSAPNYSGDGIEKRGLVRILDYDGISTWFMIGSVTGSQVSEKLGFSVSLSSDGETLVIGSPNKNAVGLNNSGVISIYSLSTTDSTWQLEEEIIGYLAGAGFGRDIDVKVDGSMICATSSGQVRVFSSSNGSPATEIADFKCLDSGDKINGLAMTENGSRLAVAVIDTNGSGIVQVFDGRFTPAPSASPSLAPSVSPTENPNDLVGGGRGVGKFEWDLDPMPELASFAFSEDSEMSEIQLHYNISLRNTVIQAFETDCSTLIPSTVAILTSQLTKISATYGDLIVDVNIHQDNVTSSSIWSDVGVGEGLISMCIRVDLTLPPPSYTSVNFHEQKLFVSVGLLQGFEITGIETNRLNATNSTGSADFDYNITACQCNADGDCGNGVLSQGNDVYLCIETAAPNLEIEDVRELVMTQGDFSTTPIVAGVQDALTEVTVDNKKAMIRYQIISAFFLDANPEDIVASGSILLALAGSDGRRYLRTSRIEVVPRHELQEQSEEGRWSIRLAVESAVPENHCSSAYSMLSAGVRLGGVIAIVSLFLTNL